MFKNTHDRIFAYGICFMTLGVVTGALGANALNCVVNHADGAADPISYKLTQLALENMWLHTTTILLVFGFRALGTSTIMGMITESRSSQSGYPPTKP